MTTAEGNSVTVIVPAYNEEQHIEACLDSVIEDLDMEVLVVDGGSTDATRDIVTGMMPRYPGLRLLDNPRRTVPSAMNIGLAVATGRVIVRLDAHAFYPPGYIPRLTAALSEYGADVAGGALVARARRQTAFGRAIAASNTNRWVMGNAAFRVGGDTVRTVDTVLFGCWPADLLRKVGGYDERLRRSQDYDLSQRLRRRGAKMIIVPDIVVEYQARSGVLENARYAFWNGFWVGYPMFAARVRFALRHLTPAAACVLGLVLIGAAGLTASWWPLALASPYLVVLALSAAAARREGLAVSLYLPLVTVGTHALYGFGTLYGALCGFPASLRSDRTMAPADASTLDVQPR